MYSDKILFASLNNKYYFLVLLFGTFLIISFVRIRKSDPYGAPEKTSKKDTET